MVEVATGGGSNSTEPLPMLLKFPHLQENSIAVCTGREFSLLGYGDIIVPGFLVSFAHSFDIRVGGKYRTYLFTSVIGNQFYNSHYTSILHGSVNVGVYTYTLISLNLL